MLLTFENLSRILLLEPASQPQNLRAELQKLERVTPRSIFTQGLISESGGDVLMVVSLLLKALGYW